MEGSESKATLLESVIKNLKKGFGGAYGVRTTPNCLYILCEVQWPPLRVGWPPEDTMNLKNSGSNLYTSHRRARTPESISVY